MEIIARAILHNLKLALIPQTAVYFSTIMGQAYAESMMDKLVAASK